MKIKSIAAICKKNKNIAIFERYSDDGDILTQYIGKWVQKAFEEARGGIRLFYLSQRGQTQHIFTITFTGKRKSASCAGGYGSRTTTGTPPIPRPSLQW